MSKAPTCFGLNVINGLWRKWEFDNTWECPAPKSKSVHLQDCSVVEAFLAYETLQHSDWGLKQWCTAAATTIMRNQLSALPLSQPFRLLETSRHAPLSCLWSPWVVLFALDNFCTALSLGLSLQSINIGPFFMLFTMEQTNGTNAQTAKWMLTYARPFKWTQGKSC